MTLENMVEMVKMAHADASVTLIKALLDSTNKAFVKECRLLEKTQALVEVGATVTYTAQTATQIAAMTGKAAMKGNGSYFASLATDIDTVTGVAYLNSSKQPLYSPDVDMPWLMDAGNLWFGRSTTTALSDGISGILVRYLAVPATLSLDTDIPAYPADFHEAVPWAVMAKLYGNANDMSRMGYFRSEYRALATAAKKWAIQRQQLSPGNVVQADF